MHRERWQFIRVPRIVDTYYHAKYNMLTTWNNARSSRFFPSSSPTTVRRIAFPRPENFIAVVIRQMGWIEPRFSSCRTTSVPTHASGKTKTFSISLSLSLVYRAYIVRVPFFSSGKIVRRLIILYYKRERYNSRRTTNSSLFSRRGTKRDCYCAREWIRVDNNIIDGRNRKERKGARASMFIDLYLVMIGDHWYFIPVRICFFSFSFSFFSFFFFFYTPRKAEYVAKRRPTKP